MSNNPLYRDRLIVMQSALHRESATASPAPRTRTPLTLVPGGRCEHYRFTWTESLFMQTADITDIDNDHLLYSIVFRIRTEGGIQM